MRQVFIHNNCYSCIAYNILCFCTDTGVFNALCYIDRYETPGGISHSALPASLHPLHVHQARRLHERRPEGPLPAHLDHQRHQKSIKGKNHAVPACLIHSGHIIHAAMLLQSVIFLYGSQDQSQWLCPTFQIWGQSFC